MSNCEFEQVLEVMVVDRGIGRGFGLVFSTRGTSVMQMLKTEDMLKILPSAKKTFISVTEESFRTYLTVLPGFLLDSTVRQVLNDSHVSI